ncbi:MAG: DnaJ domain-containing protein [Smithellaceae bacterium]
MGLSISESLKILGLTKDASLKEIKQAYKDLVNVWHPDRFTNNARLQKKANEKLKEINAAYENLVSFYENINSSESANYYSQEPPRQPPPEPPPSYASDKPHKQPGYTGYKGIIIVIFIVGFLFLLWAQNDKPENKFTQPHPKRISPSPAPFVTSPKILDEPKIEFKKRPQTQIADDKVKRLDLKRRTPPRESKIEEGLSTQSQTKNLDIPDLSRLTYEEKASIESVCSNAKYLDGPASYNRCLKNQLATLAQGERRPDLSQLTYEEKASIESVCSKKASIESVCSNAKYLQGPASYNRCLKNQLKQLYSR